MPALSLVAVLALAVLLSALAQQSVADDECAALQIHGGPAKADSTELLGSGPAQVRQQQQQQQQQPEYLRAIGRVVKASIEVSGMVGIDYPKATREFHYYVPTSYTREKPTVLWFYFAGSNTGVDCSMKSNGQLGLAFKHGLIAVGPVAKNGASWRGRIRRSGANDVKVFLAILSWFEQQGLKPAYVIINGFSIGGAMVYRLLCNKDAAPKISFGGVIGGRVLHERHICGARPNKQVPFIHLQGKRDGGIIRADSALSNWTTFSKEVTKCTGQPSQYRPTSDVVRAGQGVTCQKVDNCTKDGASTAFCTIDGCGHGYPYIWSHFDWMRRTKRITSLN